jgi:hypothetical protein
MPASWYLPSPLLYVARSQGSSACSRPRDCHQFVDAVRTHAPASVTGLFAFAYRPPKEEKYAACHASHHFVPTTDLTLFSVVRTSGSDMMRTRAGACTMWPRSTNESAFPASTYPLHLCARHSLRCPPLHSHSLTFPMRRVSCVVCRVSCVVCRVSCVVCRASCVVCRASCVVRRVVLCREQSVAINAGKRRLLLLQVVSQGAGRARGTLSLSLSVCVCVCVCVCVRVPQGHGRFACSPTERVGGWPDGTAGLLRFDAAGGARFPNERPHSGGGLAPPGQRRGHRQMQPAARGLDPPTELRGRAPAPHHSVLFLHLPRPNRC